jgi:MFS family permease
VRRLAVAGLVSVTGGEAATIALAFTIYARTGSALWLSTSFLFTFGAAGLISPFAGAVGDRFDRRRIMIACELVGALAYAALVFVRAPAAMIAIAFVAELAHAPFGAAIAAAIPNLAGEARVTWANSLVSVGSKTGRLVGPFLGGVLLAAGGASLAFGANAVSFLASAAVIATVRGTYRRASEESEEEFSGVLAGFRLTLGDPLLRNLSVAWAIMWFAVNIVVVADVPLAKSFGVGALGLGLIYTFDSAGGIVGSLAARRVRPRWERVVLLADMIAIAVTYSVVSVSPWFVLVLLAVAIGLGVDSLAGVVGTGIVQRRTPDVVRARVFAAITGLGMIANVIAFLIAGPLVDLVGPRGVYAVAAGTALVAAAVLLPALRVMRREGPPRVVDDASNPARRHRGQP